MPPVTAVTARRARTRRRPAQQRLPGIAEQATAAEEAVHTAGHRAHWFSPAASVALQLHMTRTGLSAADRCHAMLELALMGPFDSHDLSAAQIARMVSPDPDRHEIDKHSGARANVARRRKRLTQAGIIEIEARPGRSGTTRLGAVAALVLDHAETVRATAETAERIADCHTGGVSPTDTPGVSPTDTPGVSPTDTPLERRERQRARRSARVRERSDDLHPADSPRRQAVDGGWFCRRRGCPNRVSISRTGQPFDLCIGCDT